METIKKKKGWMKHKLAQNLGVCGLGIAKVHHLVKELVDDDKVVADALLTDLAKVLLECINELVEEEKCHCPVHVAVSDCKDCTQREENNMVTTVRVHEMTELTNTRDWRA